MKRPEMIFFDYGQTLISEDGFDGVRGTYEVLKHAVGNPHGYTAEEVQKEADAILSDLGWGDWQTRHTHIAEIHEYNFNAYLYESLGIKLGITPGETERIFWDAAAPGRPTEGIGRFLDLLHESGIRTAVISNISFSGKALTDRINSLIPGNRFEFIIASSEYIFRKPHRRIFDLALEKARLSSDEVWYVGDNLICDIEGAKKAGIMPVRYTGASGKNNEEIPDVISVSSWDELATLITL